MLYSNKQKLEEQTSFLYIPLNVQNNPHGCLYIVAFVLNIFENF